MTIHEFLDDLRAMDNPSLSTIFNYLADHVHELRLEGGGRLCDGADFAAGLRALALAAADPLDRVGQEMLRGDAAAPEQFGTGLLRCSGRVLTRVICPGCRHEHEDPLGCGRALGEGEYCRCTLTQKASTEIAA